MIDNNCTCAFCGKKRKECAMFIVGKNANICDECIALCNQILFEKLKEKNEFIRKIVNE